MVFSSLLFLFLFLPATILVYYVSPKKLRNAVLLAASLIFYAWGEPVYIFIMIFSTVFDYVNGLLIEKYRHRKPIARAVFIGSISGSLGILCFFKYAGFAVDTINQLFHLHIQAADLPLPVGISFYTFQTMSYIVDVYRDKVPVQKNLISFGAYVTMFPQLVAGPIVKYGDIARQLVSRTMKLDRFGEGAELFIRGLAKKVLLANNIGLLWTSVKATPAGELSVLSAWLGIIAFTFQIYFDFSGYSDMARGLGKMFGFDFLENFNYPYISKSVTEFWRRWHISLGAWFCEYIYIPLGGNRSGPLNQFRNLFAVWLATGLWHGANWNFILWGLYFGVFVTAEKLFLLKWLQRSPRFVGHVYALLIVMVGWVLFEYENLGSAAEFIGAMFGYGAHGLADRQALYDLSANVVLLIVLGFCATPLPRKALSFFREKGKMAGVVLVPAMYFLFLLLSTAYLVTETYNPFLYFRF
ncbi:MBOAT family protein [Paenibacillus melissococcoides]|uniref:MBOAT family protein n=1 Tax=Paenibacillus melissococcoides TaxID=2912268 RepID=A0ABM9G7A9_9BACL|nr:MULTISPECIES: MBOAT family protein [Paenibacillus]MEB9894594.1 MBOAT family protein [Bacillus cereus]CAH8247100.1 MBOAT family protein [Paenibacillus melissococcoides]CAH8716733.1 MBOAT family protein [Paenibacillus melissococcoides]CAH8717696.1 MBOAT family protein [Paenibacillus melissococcoides]GIO80990.1 alginate regulatory protein [Paenibacillus dendritiformis]